MHRTLGWVGTALAATMIASSFSVSVVMVRFDRTALGKMFHPPCRFCGAT